MIRVETNCGIQEKSIGFWNPQKRYQFWAGRMLCDRLYTEQEYANLCAHQQQWPVLLMLIRAKPKWYWWFVGQFYSATEDYTSEEMAYLIVDKWRKKQQRVEKAIAQVTAAQAGNQGINNTRNISRGVQVSVYQRDQGRCVRCGSNQKLEYDHIIPFSRGGSNTERNIQLLCETCNRSKGAGF